MIPVLCVLLTNLSLEQAENAALSQNKEILFSEQEVLQYRARNLMSIVAWLPNITFDSMYVDMQKQQSAFMNRLPKSFVMNQIVFNQTLFSTDLIYGLRQARQYLKSTLSDQQIVINDTLLKLRMAYYGVVLSELSLDVQEEVIGYLKESLDDAEKKLEAGKSTSFEVNQSKVDISNANTTYHTLVKNMKMAKNQLILAMGAATDREVEISLSEKTIPIESYPEIVEKLALLQQKGKSLGDSLPSFRESKKNTAFSLFTEEEIENWVRQARGRRPEIQKTYQLSKIARDQIRMQQGGYFPKISLFADYGYYKPYNGLFIEQQYNFAGGIKLSWNVFDSFKRELKIKEAQYANFAAGLTVEQVCERSDIAVRDEISQMEEALFAYAASHDAMLLASQAMQEAKVRLSAGTISPLQYRDATRAWAEARRSADEARFAILQAYFQLRHDAGLDVK